MKNQWGYREDYSAICNEALIDTDWLRNKKLFITGATGLIGTALVDFLAYLNDESQLNIDIAVGSRNIESAEKRFADYTGVRIVPYDMNQEVDEATIGTNDYVIHCASVADPRMYTEQPVDTIESILAGTKGILEYSKKIHARTLYISSVEVYGDTSQITGEIYENSYGVIDTLQPRSSYPEAKRLSEALCTAYHAQYGTDVVIARPSKVYGPSISQSDNRIMAHMLRTAAVGEDIQLKSDGLDKFSFCYVTDAVSALMTMLIKGEPGEAYNISDKESYVSLRDVASWQAEVAGVSVSFGEAVGSAASKGGAINSERLEELGWRALTHIEQGVKKQFASIKQHN